MYPQTADCRYINPNFLNLKQSDSDLRPTVPKTNVLKPTLLNPKNNVSPTVVDVLNTTKTIPKKTPNPTDFFFFPYVLLQSTE